MHLDRNCERMSLRASSLLVPFEQQISLSASRLHDLSPLTILGRGYAVARSQDGHIVKAVEQVSPGENVSVMLSNGELDCKVEAVLHIDTDTATLEDK